MDDLKIIGQEHVGSIKFTGIEGGFGRDKKAMLVKDIAKIHKQTVGNINLLINRARKRFKDGIDIIDLKQERFAIVLNKSGFNRGQINASKHIYLLSERGYAKLLKILEDDKAWDIYDQLVDNYFNMRQAIDEHDLLLLKEKRLSIMDDNKRTRQANALISIAMESSDKHNKQLILNEAARLITGKDLNLPKEDREEYTATLIANAMEVSPQMVGRVANQLGIKATTKPGENRYGRWITTKARDSDRMVDQWLYSKTGMNAVVDELQARIE